MRYAGQGHNVSVTLPATKITAAFAPQLVREFERRYKQLYGSLVPGAHPQVMTWRLTGRSDIVNRRFQWGDQRAGGASSARGRRSIYLPLEKKFRAVPVHDRYSLKRGTRIAGPLILEERESTLVVAVDARVNVLDDHSVLIEIREFE
jgi:N-methylhydantoinase A